MRFSPLSRAVVTGFGLSLATAFLVSPLPAAITVDGTADTAYGTALSVQTEPTQFGDSTAGATDYANGSELDQVFATKSGGMLYVCLTGNLQTTYNPVELFIDTGIGGQNTLLSNSANGAGGAANAMAGLTFDTGFTPFYYLTLNGGGGSQTAANTYYVDYQTLPAAGGTTQQYLGSTGAGGNGTLGGGTAGGTNGDNGVLAAINNSNTGGVTTTDASQAGMVKTGIEFGIPLSLIGNPTGNIRLSAFINGSGHNFLSNQVAGPLPSTYATTNLGAPAGVNFSTITGNQFVTLAVPEPGTVAMLGVGAAALAGWAYRRRR